MSRWVRIQVDIFDHELFASEPLSEREAWIWMIGRAAWQETKHRVGSTVYDVPVGSFFATVRQLQEAWKWRSTKRVHGFLAMLKRETMIETRTETGKTLISICNYNKYQDVNQSRETEWKQERKQRGNTKDTITPKVEDNSLRSLSGQSPESQAPAHVSKIAIVLSAAAGKRVGITFDEARQWQRDFPAVDVPQQLRAMRAWLDANPAKRKTEKGMRRFVVSWLAKEQDRGGPPRSMKPRTVGESFVDLARDMGILEDGKRDQRNEAGLFPEGNAGGNGPVLDLAVSTSKPDLGELDDFTRRLLHRS